METKAKKENYSQLQIAKIESTFKLGAANYEEQKKMLETLANDPVFSGDKTARQISAKLQWLARQKGAKCVYIKKVYAPKTGGTPILKGELLEALADALGVESEKLDSMQTATKASLLLVLGEVKKLNSRIGELEG